MSAKANKPGFAVLDFETGGLGDWEDILEIGVVLLDSNYVIESEFTTLATSHRRIRNPWAHGIDEPQLEGSPDADIAFAELMSILAGRYVVAHNASFEKRSIIYHAEQYGSIGKDMAQAVFIDTMPIAQELTGKRKLTMVTDALNIPHLQAHAALSDAAATAMLLQIAAERKSEKLELALVKATPWPMRFQRARRLPSIYRLSAEDLLKLRSAWLKDVSYGDVERESFAYSELVARYSLNFRLSAEEKAVLSEVIASESLSAAAVRRTHEAVYATMETVAFPSKHLPKRKYLLSRLANDLGFPKTEDEVVGNGDGVELLPANATLMLSGALSSNQTELQKFYARKGHTITKKLQEASIIVVGHHDTTNKQVIEARKLGLPVISEISLAIHLQYWL